MMKIATIQTELVWEDAVANRANFDVHLKECSAADIILLPEMFTTGFSMQPAGLAEGMEGPSMDWMRRRAAHYQAVIAGSLIIRDDGKFYNRLIWMRPDGTFEQYDKRHLFTLAGEHHAYEPGSAQVVVEYKGWRICPLICYDLRFPVWSRNVFDYDLLIYLANWPRSRAHHWKSLLTARAIENQSYVIGVNRVGKDENALHYGGDTTVVDYAGNLQYRMNDRSHVAIHHLDREQLRTYRARFSFLPDRDTFTLDHT